MRRTLFFSALAVVATASLAGRATAYEAIAVTDGGTLSGTVTIEGTAPPPAKIEVKVEKPETIAIKCDVHGWMSGYWVATETPYVAVTDASGSFKISDLPPGDYDVELWQEKLGKAMQKASIKPKEETKVAWKMAAK